MVNKESSVGLIYAYMSNSCDSIYIFIYFIFKLYHIYFTLDVALTPDLRLF
jgi:hypothetical protein